MELGEIEIPQSRLQQIDITFDIGKIFSHSPQPFSMPISGRDIWNPNEIGDHCVNPACKEYQDNVEELLRDINEGFEDVDRTGDWTEINQEDLRYLSQFSESALDMADERDIEWSSPEAQENWMRIEDMIDDVGQNFADALESTTSPENDRVPGFQGFRNISNCYSSLRNLSELEDKINESDIDVAEEETSNENEEDERKEWIETWEGRIDEVKEEIDELKAEIDEMKEEKQEQAEEWKKKTQKQIMKRREQVTKRREQLTEYRERLTEVEEEIIGESEVEAEESPEMEEEDAPERDRDEEEKGAVSVIGNTGRDDEPPPSTGTATVDSEESEAETATAMANGGGGDNAGDGGSSTTGSNQHTETSGKSEQHSEWKQRWIGQPEPTRGPDFSNDSNGQSPEKSGPTRGDDSDREQTDDDDTPGGRV